MYHFDGNDDPIDSAQSPMDRSKTSFANLFKELVVLQVEN